MWACIDHGHALSPGLKPSSLAWELAAQGHTGHGRMNTLCQLILLLPHHSSFCLHTRHCLSVGKITWQGKGNLTQHEDWDASLEHTKEAVQGCPLILDLGMQWHSSLLTSKEPLFRSRCQWHKSEYTGFTLVSTCLEMWMKIWNDTCWLSNLNEVVGDGKKKWGEEIYCCFCPCFIFGTHLFGKIISCLGVCLLLSSRTALLMLWRTSSGDISEKRTGPYCAQTVDFFFFFNSWLRIASNLQRKYLVPL